jgi:hypothetical protein
MMTASERDIQLLGLIGEVLTFSTVEIKGIPGRNVESLTSDSYEIDRQVFNFMILHSDFLAQTIVKGDSFTYTNQNGTVYTFKVSCFEDTLHGWVKLNAELQ